MSRRNREKRAAKLKDRRRAAAGRTSAFTGGDAFGSTTFSSSPFGSTTFDDGGPDRVALQQIMQFRLRAAATCSCGDIDQHVSELLDECGSSGELEAAADLTMTAAVRAAWEAGWQPIDIHEHARRRLDPAAVEFVREAVVIESRRYAPAMVHPRWRASSASVAAGIDPAVAVPHLRGWAQRHGRTRRESLAMVLRVMAVFLALPVLERLLPLPGAGRHAVAPPAGTVDEKALGKVRALLAKAESTEFPEEAEALSAKAQELMSRYSLHQAVVDHESGQAPVASGRRLWLDAPYAAAKALLVQVIARANRCRVVWTEHLGFVTIVGTGTELDMVELLTTSLLVQANRAMLAAGRQVTRSGTSRTRSFRQSFLVAYGTRIGERLDAVSVVVSAEVQEDSRLLPVLAARTRAADDMTERLFPGVVNRSLAANDAAGWGAGRAAADLALFDVRGQVAG